MIDPSGGPFKFSEPYLQVEYTTEKDLGVATGEKAIIINANDTETIIQGKPLEPWKSSIYSSVTIPKGRRLIRVAIDTDFFSLNPYPHAEALKSKWSHVHQIFPLPHLEQTNLWRSEKENVGKIAFNLWYAAAGTDCGIHKEHDFREIHTQVYGIGRMQKFRDRNDSSIYQEVFMSPGYTHDPFYDEARDYPWHRYWADTDCIWLAIEFYDQ